jgi:hypothetical protein
MRQFSFAGEQVYGEDVEAALRFLFAAMSRKADGADPFQGIPVFSIGNGCVTLWDRDPKHAGSALGPAVIE